MNNIIEYIKNNQVENLINEYNTDKESLLEMDEEGITALNLAIIYGNNEIIKYVLKDIPQQYIEMQRPDHPIIVAIENNNKEIFNLLYHLNINLDIKGKNKNNLLQTAILSNADDDFLIQLSKKTDPFYENNRNKDSIVLALEKNKNNFLMYLFNNNSIEKFLDKKEYYLKYAIKNSNNFVLEQLIEHQNENLDELFQIAFENKNIIALEKIVSKSDFIPGSLQIRQLVETMCLKYEYEKEQQAAEKIVDFLFSIKLPFEQFANEDGKSAWMLAIENANVELFDKFIKSNAQIDVVDNQGDTPLMYAIEIQNLEFVSYLLKHKANPNHKNKYKNTPLIRAVQKNNFDIVKELLKYPVYVNEENSLLETAMSIAVKFRRMPIVTQLIWAGAEINKNPHTFLQTEDIYQIGLTGQYEKVTSLENVKCVDDFIALSQLGFNLNQENEDGDSFLLHFIKNDYRANYKTLLRCNMNPNQIDSDGNSALMCTMSKTADFYFKTFLNRFSDIDLTVKNKNNQTVYDICYNLKKFTRMEDLIKYDDNLTLGNAQKALQLISQYGNLTTNWSYLEKFKNKFSLTDEFNNNLLMLSIQGNNLENFQFLLDKFNIDLEQKNDNQHNAIELIDLLPIDRKNLFTQAINSFKKKQLNNL